MAMNLPARVVLLNGAGSVGKTSIAKAFQAIAGQPFLHVQMDGFLDMTPPALANHHDAFHYENIGTSTRPEIAISEGPAGTRTLRGMHAAVAAMGGARQRSNRR